MCARRCGPPRSQRRALSKTLTNSANVDALVAKLGRSKDGGKKSDPGDGANPTDRRRERCRVGAAR